jgi:glyoxylase-like metal-dependent hydrolase (beta-lactamase superfamily II)/8-oxo-dGTP pyrophosphatase MutT (NUDIX family)
MSESLPGMPAAPAPVPRDAAVAIVFRRVATGVEVVWTRRELSLPFAGGFVAFPGGRFETQDQEVAVLHAQGLEAALRATAARELFEETGMAMADGQSALPADRRRAMRKALLEKSATFAQLLRTHGLRLRSGDFLEAGRWVTPAFLPSRFDARFFLVEAPPGMEAEMWPGEHTEGAWISPSAALDRWEDGTALLHPPTLHALRVLSSFTSPAEAAARIAAPPDCEGWVGKRIEFQRGICLIPLRTPTLPPATHTNCYLIGNGELLIVDPGSEEDPELEALFELIERRRAEGARPKAVVLTHHHRDHIGGAEKVKRALKLPLWCHARTADRLPFPSDRLLAEGEVLELEGSPAMRWKVLFTPGHARGHLCLFDLRSRATLVGDLVAGVGTILIDPPEGQMGEYLRQLARLRELPVGTLYPAHGPVLADGPAKLAEYLSHRARREQRVLSSIGPDGASVEEIVASAYDDVAEFARPIAERSTQAILIKLMEEGQVRLLQGQYFRIEATDPSVGQ